MCKMVVGGWGEVAKIDPFFREKFGKTRCLLRRENKLKQKLWTSTKTDAILN